MGLKLLPTQIQIYSNRSITKLDLELEETSPLTLSNQI